MPRPGSAPLRTASSWPAAMMASPKPVRHHTGSARRNPRVTHRQASSTQPVTKIRSALSTATGPRSATAN